MGSLDHIDRVDTAIIGAILGIELTNWLHLEVNYLILPVAVLLLLKPILSEWAKQRYGGVNGGTIND